MKNNSSQQLGPTDVLEMERAEAEAQREREAAADIEADDLRWLASTRRGRRVLARIINDAGVDLIGFSTNAMTMAFIQGRRAQGMRLKEAVRNACPNEFVLLIEEQIDGRTDQH